VQLLNQWESPGSPPAAKDDIDSLPLVTIAQEHIGLYRLHLSTSFFIPEDFVIWWSLFICLCVSAR